MKTTSREYSGKNVDLKKLNSLITQFFREENFRVQNAMHPRGFLIQAQKGGILRTLLSTDKAFTLVIEGEPSDFRIKVGVAEWLKGPGDAKVEQFFRSPMIAYSEVPEALWSYEIEHQLWHYVENQIDLGIQ